MLFPDLTNSIFNPAPTDAHRFTIPCLDTLADQKAHLLRQDHAACLLNLL